MMPIGAVSTEVRRRRSRSWASRSASTASLITSLTSPNSTAPTTVGSTRTATAHGPSSVSWTTSMPGITMNATIGQARRRPSATE